MSRASPRDATCDLHQWGRNAVIPPPPCFALRPAVASGDHTSARSGYRDSAPDLARHPSHQIPCKYTHKTYAYPHCTALAPNTGTNNKQHDTRRGLSSILGCASESNSFLHCDELQPPRLARAASDTRWPPRGPAGNPTLTSIMPNEMPTLNKRPLVNVASMSCARCAAPPWRWAARAGARALCRPTRTPHKQPRERSRPTDASPADDGTRDPSSALPTPALSRGRGRWRCGHAQLGVRAFGLGLAPPRIPSALSPLPR